jgi:rhodanese-related sulfurtransferase
MERFFEFMTQHYILVSAFLGLLIAYILVEIQRGGRSVSPQTLTSMVNKQKALVIDLRDPNEFKQGHITGSRNIPYARLTEKLQELPKDGPIILVCQLGQVAGTAARQLKSQGIQDVAKLEGGLSNWKSQSLPLVKK